MKYINLFDTQAEYDATKKYYPNVSYIEATDEVVYQYEPDYSKEYLTFEALESGTFSLLMQSGVDTTYITSVSYSIDNGSTWVTTNNSNTDVTITTPTIAQGDKVLWKGEGKQFGKNLMGGNTSNFSSTGTFNVSGNMMSLLYGDNFANQTTFPSGSQFTFYSLLNNTKVVSAENLVLPALTLVNRCYCGLIRNCKSLTTAPKLPATTLATSCYDQMFAGSTLTTAPILPATTLVSKCYLSMFQNCTNLNSITMLATNISASDCLNNWVQGVQTTSGTFTKAASMTTLPTGTSGIPSGWTVVDIN